jgi:Domain of unknown function (DUF4157)
MRQTRIIDVHHLLRAGRITVFAPKTANAQAKGTDVSTNGVTQQKPANVEQERMLPASPGPSWDFSKTPIFHHAGRAPSGHGADGAVDQLMRMPGEPLESGARRDAERHFGRDFGNVRVHRDPKAGAAASAVGAPAFTLGRHIVARDGAIDLATPEGHAILFHELTHIVQQAAFDDHDLAGAPVLDAAHPSEREARMETAAPSPLAAPAIQRGPLKIAISKQHIEIDLTNSLWRQTLEFEAGQTQIVYVLRDATTGEFLKVGKTSVGEIADRFGEYVAAGNKWSRKLAADAWTIRARSKTNVEAFEKEMRAGLESAGARLPWDNTRVPGKGPRLGRPGQGIPDTKPQTETQFIDEAEQLRVKHADPNVPKRRGMSSKEKAKLQATEDKAAAEAMATVNQDAGQAAPKDTTGTGPDVEQPPAKTEVKPGGDAPASPAKPAQVDKTPAPPTSDVKGGPGPATQPKVETPPVVEGGGGGAARIGVEASRFRSAGRLLAEEAPGLLLQAMLMFLFPPEVRIHNDRYDELRSKKIDPAQQQALKEQEAAFNKLAADDPAKSIWAAITVESGYWLEPTSSGDVDVTLQDLRFVGMKLSREYLLVEGKKFDVGKGQNLSKTVTYSVPIFGPATHGAEEPIRNYRRVRESLTDSAYKVRMSAMLAMYKIADANPFLKNQLIRDLQGMRNDDNDLVQELATHMLSRLKPE